MGGIFCNVEEIKIKALERYYYVRKKEIMLGVQQQVKFSMANIKVSEEWMK